MLEDEMVKNEMVEDEVDINHTYYRIINTQNLFQITSRGVQGCTATDFRFEISLRIRS